MPIPIGARFEDLSPTFAGGEFFGVLFLGRPLTVLHPTRSRVQQQGSVDLAIAI